MTTYVIGDVQGCHASLLKLLTELKFDSKYDRLWFAGDLVNRGSDSLSVLRFVQSLGTAAECVLGNHDLHLLAVYTGLRELSRKDTFNDILQAPDVDQLMSWLRHRPLLLKDDSSQFILTHAGLHPSWTLPVAEAEAHYVESLLQSEQYADIFKFMYGDRPRKWKPGRGRKKRLRFAVNCFTRMRFCTRSAQLDFENKGPPGSPAKNLMPWFEVPGRCNQHLKTVFGHWSTVGDVKDKNVIPIDTGCVWGGELTAYALESELYYKIQCASAKLPE